MAVRREIRSVETQLADVEAELQQTTEELRWVSQERANTEEDLMNANLRLKSLQGELKMLQERAEKRAASKKDVDNGMTLGDLQRISETTLLQVLDERFGNEAFLQTVADESMATVDKVRVEYEGDEAYWALPDHYTFEMLLQDAARYWDISQHDSVLHDERGAIWPADAYVSLELRKNMASAIRLKVRFTLHKLP